MGGALLLLAGARSTAAEVAAATVVEATKADADVTRGEDEAATAPALSVLSEAAVRAGSTREMSGSVADLRTGSFAGPERGLALRQPRGGGPWMGSRDELRVGVRTSGRGERDCPATTDLLVMQLAEPPEPREWLQSA
jgi:hypothetical protein